MDEDAAAGVPPHKPGPVEGGGQEAMGSEDGGQPDLEEPGREHAQETSGGH